MADAPTNWLREMTPEEAADARARHKVPPCAFCDMGGIYKNPRGEPVCTRHRNENAELTPDQKRGVLARQTKRERKTEEP